MVEISLSGSGEGSGRATGRGYSTIRCRVGGPATHGCVFGIVLFALRNSSKNTLASSCILASSISSKRSGSSD